MKIIIDYDNDQIRIGHDEDFKNNTEIINMKVKNIHEFKPVLIEILNMIHDNDEPISLESQSDGRILLVEEY